MRIILHIFKKDLRHHWPEALLSCALISIYTLDQPRHWHERFLFSSFLVYRILDAMPAFLILAWMFLITRVVQDEPLAGVNQYWTTRPFQWPKLLCAKLLFFLAFVHAPLFIAQIIILKMAHFSVLPYIPSLILLQLLTFVIVVVPPFALASLTPSLGRTTLVLIGLIVFIVAVATLASFLPQTESLADNYENLIPFLSLAIAFAIILIQYSVRKTRISWTIFIVFLVLAGASNFVPSVFKKGDAYFPAPTPAHPLPAQFSFDSTVSFEREKGERFEYFADKVRLQLPIRIEGFDQSTFVRIRSVRMEIDAPTGELWNSHWLPHYEQLVASRSRAWPEIDVKGSIVRETKDRTVNARLYLALDVYRLGIATHLPYNGKALPLPDGVHCVPENYFGLKCLSPLRNMGPFLIEADLPNNNCKDRNSSDEETRHPGPAYEDFLNDELFPDFDFTPIHETSLTLSRFSTYEDTSSNFPICSGTNLLITSLKFQYTTRAEIPLRDLNLKAYMVTYPLKIVPTPKQPPSRKPSDTLSFNFSSLYLHPIPTRSSP